MSVTIDGFLNLHKPAGPSSFAIVGLVRRLTGIRKVGHGGTLDPAASGVLPICVGQATRMAEHLLEGRKEYLGRVQLGVATDTYDAEGAVAAEGDWSGITRQAVEALLPRFTGSILQVPPMYSALKREGQPLYTLARKGLKVERPARPVEVHRLELASWEPPFLTLRIACGHGMYIRSLAHDLGEALGCGAHLAGLTRTQSGPFRIGEAVTPEDLARAAGEGWWEALLFPLDHAVPHWRAAVLDEVSCQDVREGRTCPQGAPPARPPEEGEPCRAYTDDGRLLALMAFDAAAASWRPRKVFAQQGAALHP